MATKLAGQDDGIIGKPFGLQPRKDPWYKGQPHRQAVSLGSQDDILA
jgi:hypothetical protein